MGMIINQPYWAPAFVDNTRCEVPMAMLANKRPGPKLLMNRSSLIKGVKGWAFKLHKI